MGADYVRMWVCMHAWRSTAARLSLSACHLCAWISSIQPEYSVVLGVRAFPSSTVQTKKRMFVVWFGSRLASSRHVVIVGGDPYNSDLATAGCFADVLIHQQSKTVPGRRSVVEICTLYCYVWPSSLSVSSPWLYTVLLNSRFGAKEIENEWLSLSSRWFIGG